MKSILKYFLNFCYNNSAKNNECLQTDERTNRSKNKILKNFAQENINEFLEQFGYYLHKINRSTSVKKITFSVPGYDDSALLSLGTKQEYFSSLEKALENLTEPYTTPENIRWVVRIKQ